MAERRLDVVIGAKDVYSKNMTKAQRAALKTGSAFEDMGKSIRKGALIGSAALVGMGAVRILKDMTTQAEKFETAVSDMAKVTDESLDSIKKKILAIDSSLGSSTELVKGYYQTISAGVTEPTAAMELLVTAAKASRGSHTELSLVVEGLTGLMEGYEGKIKDVTEASDILFAIEKVGKTEFQKIIPVIGGLAKISSDLNVTQQELAGTFATLTKTAGGTSEAATRYEALLTALLKPTKDLSAVLEKMGFKSSEAAIKQLGLVETLRQIKSHTDGSSQAMGQLLGRKEAILGFSAASTENFTSMAESIENIGAAAGGTERAFKEWEKTSVSATERMRAELEKLSIAAGKSLLPIKKELTEIVIFWAQASAGILETSKSFEELITDKAFERAKAMRTLLNATAELAGKPLAVTLGPEERALLGLPVKGVAPAEETGRAVEMTEAQLKARERMEKQISAVTLATERLGASKETLIAIAVREFEQMGATELQAIQLEAALTAKAEKEALIAGQKQGTFDAQIVAERKYREEKLAIQREFEELEKQDPFAPEGTEGMTEIERMVFLNNLKLEEFDRYALEQLNRVAWLSQSTEEVKAAWGIIEKKREELAAKSRTQINKSMLQGFIGDMITMSGASSSIGKKMFKVQQGISIGTAVVKGFESATSAWAAGMSTGGPWAPFVAAAYTAASLAKTGALIASIKSSKPGGGGGGGGGGRGGISIGAIGGPLPGRDVSAPEGFGDTQALQTQTITVNIHNPLSQQNWAEITEKEIIPQINDAVENRNINLTVRTVEV